MNKDNILQNSNAIRVYLQSIIESSIDRNHIDYFTIMKFDTPDMYDINCQIIISVETVKDAYPVSTRQEVNQVALDSFQQSIKEFKEERRHKAGATYRIAAIL